MHFSRLFIERPIMTALVVFAILLFGVLGYRSLPVAALPSVEYPTIQVAASLPGADPETMASSVATPLEREFSTIAGIKQMSSSNAQGSAAITIQFDLSRKIDEAAGHPGRDLARRWPPSAQYAASAVVSEGEPGGAAHLLPRSQFHDCSAVHR